MFSTAMFSTAHHPIRSGAADAVLVTRCASVLDWLLLFSWEPPSLSEDVERLRGKASVLGLRNIALLWTVFDATWSVFKSQYTGNEQSAEVGRLRLANAVLGAYRNGITEPDAVQRHAIASMQSWTRRDEYMPS
jgi:hypothetical protein